jgi:hypothetical protein
MRPFTTAYLYISLGLASVFNCVGIELAAFKHEREVRIGFSTTYNIPRAYSVLVINSKLKLWYGNLVGVSQNTTKPLYCNAEGMERNKDCKSNGRGVV